MAKAFLGKYIQPEALNRLRHLELAPRGLVEGTMAGAHKSPFHGFAVEFASHREYVPGDDLRHLDWNVYFRHDRLAIKQYEMETDMSVHILLDVSASMRYGSGQREKLSYAARMAATLAYLVIEKQDRVSLATFDEQVRSVLAPSNSLAQIIRMTETFDAIEPVAKSDVAQPLREISGRLGRRGIVCLLSDFFVDLDSLEQALQRLRYQRHEVVLFHVMHPDEIDFQLDGLIRFLGLEGADELRTRPDDVRKAYLEAKDAFCDRLDSVCDANRCERILCDTGRSMGELFADYLQSRSLKRRW